MPDNFEQRSQLARAWDDAAAGYDAYFVPRFAPWVELAVTDADLPAGPIMVPCCGTFPEVELLIEHFPDREITGIDLSDGMVALARERTSVWPNVEVITGTRRHSIHAGPASAPPWCRSSSCRRWQAEV